MRKRLYLMFAGLLLTCATTHAAIEPVNSRVQGTDLFDLIGTGSLDLSDNKFWMIDGGVWTSSFDVQSVKNRIIFGIDESDMNYHSAYSYRITFDVEYQELIDGALTTKNLYGITLQTYYDPVRGSSYQDRGVFAFTGGLDVHITNIDIEEESAIGSNVWTDVTSLFSAIYLESEIVTERYYIFNPSSIPSTSITATVDGDEVIVSWPFIEGAEEYDLEWTWISRYDADINGNLQLLGAGSVYYNFNENATRVRLNGQNYFRIPLIYGQGYIALRYRGIGRTGANYTIPIEGTWSSDAAPNGAAGVLTGYPNYFSVSPHENDEINYGVGMSFIENGVHSVGVTYMDGVLKPRQSQAKLSTQDKIIVGSTIYDHYGRPAIGVMSTPVDQSTLGYVDNLNMYNDGINPAVPYEKQHFDLDQTLVCGSMEPAPPMDPVNSTGAANYYSPENTDQEGYNAYLPDAEGYPFVQVKYTADPTGRIKRVGGVGPDHQFGDTDGGDAHYTEYYYTTPDDDELWELFGNDAARVQNYTKVITKDVHGQFSIALIDGMGRTVATYLEGPAPTGLDAIEGNVGMAPIGKDFIPYNQDMGNGLIEVQTPIVILEDQVVYTFNYDFTGVTFNECLPENICYDCIYELEITIIPVEPTACEMTDGDAMSPDTISTNGIYHETYTVGSITSFDTDCDDPLVFSEEFPGDEQFTVKFGCAGEYYVIKKLKVSEAPIDYYWEQYQSQDTCMLTYDDFFDNALAQVDWTQCDEYEPCEFNFLLEYGTVDSWLADNPTLDSTDYDTLRTSYLADCGTLSPCDFILPLLLLDMSPGGQYGSINTADNLSVYNTTSNYLGGDWLDVTFHNEDGSISYVDADGDLVEDDLPTDLTITEFFNHWQDSWAMDLIEFHPEYCYYEFCQSHPAIAGFEHDFMAITSFDEACSSGYINPAETAGYFDLPACSTYVDDPLLDLGNMTTQSDMDDIMNALFDTYDIYEAAVAMAGDNPGSVAFGSGCNADQHWKNFQVLYMSKRFQVYELVLEDYVDTNCTDAACVGDATCTTSPFKDSSPRHISWGGAMGYDMANIGTTDWEAEADTMAMDIDTMCIDMCTAQAVNWMQQLAGCEDQLVSETWDPGQTTYDYIYAELIEICVGGCAGGCFTLTQEDPSVSSDPGNDIYASFEELITYNFDLTETCTHLLITNPKPGACADLGPYYLNECSCNMLLSSASPEEFADIYGYTPYNFEGDSCNCSGYDLNADGTISGAEITSLASAELTTQTHYVCPEICLRCEQFTMTTYGYIDQFETDYSIAYDSIPSLFTAFVNGEAGSDFTWQEITSFIGNCVALAAGVNEPMYNFIDQKAYDIVTMLDALNPDDLTTSGSYNHTALPEYFYSGLYPCTDQSTATFSYSPSITSNVLEFTLMGDGCTGLCTLSVEILGSLPGYFANATEYFQNILSFDQVFVTDADLSATTLNIFHVLVTLDDQSGGTAQGELLVTSCYDIFELLETSTPIGTITDLLLCPGVPEEEGDPCMENLIAQAALDAQAQYEAYLDEQYDLFVQSYVETCSQVTETFNMEYEANRYHYTLLYYDQSGNLVRTVPPKGVIKLTSLQVDDAIDYANGSGSAVYPSHTYNTYYKHNSLNQVVEVTTPDGGTSHYFYDHIGRLVVSQNARQEDFMTGLITGSPGTGSNIPAYSYTKYDELGRVYEVGEIIHPTAMTNTISKDPASLDSWLEEDVVGTDNVVRNNITLIYYDNAYSQDAADAFKIPNGDDLFIKPGYGHTRNRITATAVIEDYVNHTAGVWIYPEPDYINHYRYDVHGNVQSYLQEIPELDQYNNPYRRTDYEYDLISGNPNYIYYQKGKPDQYIHHYRYDADNRLKEVWTSDDGQVWDRDANYEYREDGYLARTELGDMKVQGMDYAYTLHGWIKTLNSGVLNPDFDMGKDGDLADNAQYSAYEDDVHDLHARDVLSYTVGYYSGDYTQISAGVTGYDEMPVAVAGALATDIDELFNGNITHYMASTTDETGTRLDPLAIGYHYDQLHRFKESHVFTYTDITSSNSTYNAVRQNVSSGLGDYEMYVDYDMNGNIDTLARRAYGATNSMDLFRYHYTASTNKLGYVTDSETGTGSSGYGDIQHGQAAGNYGYHDDGSLKADAQEHIDYIDWYPNGLVKRIYRDGTTTDPDLYFEYDPTGNRVLKVEMTRDGSFDIQTEDLWNITYYATDANGIDMAIYELDIDDEDPAILTRKEQMLYGGSRLGMETTSIEVQDVIDPVTACNNDGLATAVIAIQNPDPAGEPEIMLELNGVPMFTSTVLFVSTYPTTAQDLANAINAENTDLYAYVENIYVGVYYVVIKELVAGALQGELVMTLDAGDATSTYIERQPSIGDCYESRTLGKKMFELSNYLGNVMEVIADRKIAHNNSGTIDYFEADVISYSDYYPFGMEMPGRSIVSSSGYRYAYNGMEVDHEVSGHGNSYTTQFRQYDPRLGRWKSLDPMMGEYPDQSPFVAFNNNPSYFVDPLGLEGIGPKGKGKSRHGRNHLAKKDKQKKDKQDRGDKGDGTGKGSGKNDNIFYDQFRDRINSGLYRIFSAKYRAKFNTWRNSPDNYTIDFDWDFDQNGPDRPTYLPDAIPCEFECHDGIGDYIVYYDRSFDLLTQMELNLRRIDWPILRIPLTIIWAGIAFTGQISISIIKIPIGIVTGIAFGIWNIFSDHHMHWGLYTWAQIEGIHWLGYTIGVGDWDSYGIFGQPIDLGRNRGYDWRGLIGFRVNQGGERPPFVIDVLQEIGIRLKIHMHINIIPSKVRGYHLGGRKEKVINWYYRLSSRLFN